MKNKIEKNEERGCIGILLASHSALPLMCALIE